MHLLMWVEGKTINIEVAKHYIYDARISSLGDEKKNQPGDGSAWGWIKHLQEKIWWSEESERKFLSLAKTIKF